MLWYYVIGLRNPNKNSKRTALKKRLLKEGIYLAFDYNRLRGKIREVFRTQDKFAKALGISKATLSLKLNNVSEFTQKEMLTSMNLLRENPEHVDLYFFTPKVRKTE